MFPATYFPKSYYTGDYYPPDSDALVILLYALSLGTSLTLGQPVATASIYGYSNGLSIGLAYLEEETEVPDILELGTPILQGKPRPQAKRLGRGKILLLPTRHGVVIAYKSGNNQYRRLS